MKKFSLICICLICTCLICAAAAESIYQVALLQSLAQGYFDGIMTVGELKTHGDTGIGTFDGLNFRRSIEGPRACTGAPGRSSW